MDLNCSVNIMKTYGTNMTKLTGAALDRAVANTMGIKSVHNCEDWVGQEQLCKYGNEVQSCTSSPMDCQCCHDALTDMAEEKNT